MPDPLLDDRLFQLAESAKRFQTKTELSISRNLALREMNNLAGLPMHALVRDAFVRACVADVEHRFACKSILKREVDRSFWSLNKEARRYFPDVGFIACFALFPKDYEHVGIVIEVGPKQDWVRTIEIDVTRKENRLFTQHRLLEEPGNLKLQGFLKAF